MSSEAPKLHKFLIYAPDKTDEGAFERRLSVRPKHLEGAKVLASQGVLKLGGAMLTPESIATPTSEKKLIGSTLIMEAESLEKMTEIIHSDIYYTAGVWDPEKLVIVPFLQADNSHK